MQIRDNISLGDPPHISDLSKIQQAAQLGGADAFIERLPEQYNTYLDRPVESYYSPLPEGTTTLFGQPVDYGRVRDANGMDGGGAGNRGLSGGQVQRIALSVSSLFIRIFILLLTSSNIQVTDIHAFSGF